MSLYHTQDNRIASKDTERREHGKDRKHQLDILKHSVYDLKHSIYDA